MDANNVNENVVDFQSHWNRSVRQVESQLDQLPSNLPLGQWQERTKHIISDAFAKWNSSGAIEGIWIRRLEEESPEKYKIVSNMLESLEKPPTSWSTNSLSTTNQKNTSKYIVIGAVLTGAVWAVGGNIFLAVGTGGIVSGILMYRDQRIKAEQYSQVLKKKLLTELKEMGDVTVTKLQEK